MVFDGGDFSQCTLHVPAGSNTAYQADTFWSKFSNIAEDATTGINKSQLSVKSVAHYNLSGQRINGQRGINIVQMSDGTTRKVIVK